LPGFGVRSRLDNSLRPVKGTAVIKTNWAIAVIAIIAAPWASAVTQNEPQKSLAPAPLTRDDVLSVKDGRFYLYGRPFAEISFNKFDLFWELYGELAAGRPLTDDNPMVQAQTRALRDLHKMGFKTIRVFGLPWGPSGPDSYSDPQKRVNLYAAIDKALDLCDRYHIRSVWCLGSDTFTDTKLDRGWKYGEEQLRELMANPNSRGRQLLYRYLDETISRYKNRRTILMWEIANEETLSADIGDKDGIYEGQRMPTLKDVSLFCDGVAKRIKSDDPLRLVNNGGSSMRESQWHLYQRQGWPRDTFEEQFKCVDLLFGHSAVDVFDIHYYPDGKLGYAISGTNGQPAYLNLKGYMTIAKRIGKPLMIGEFGFAPAPKSDEKTWKKNPDYFESYADTAAAKPWIQHALNGVVGAGVQLSYWWTYQSDRPVDQKSTTRFDIDLERNPELLKCFIDANRRLQHKLRTR